MKPGKSNAKAVAIVIAALSLIASPPLMAKCGNDASGFSSWLTNFEAQARANGIKQATIDRALAGLTYDPNVIRLDRSQKSFKLSFEEFYKKRVGTVLIQRAKSRLQSHASLFSSIEKRYGVPREILVSIWGLETNFGQDASAKYSIIQSIATLAYDCRRSQFFTDHLMAALRIVQKGDISPQKMRGGWAGEIGQVQFLPGSYDKYAVDFDGDGHRDLVSSVPDLLASTANYLRAHGWQRGAPWGPGTANYAVIREWNRADVYVKTISIMASRLKG